MDIERLLQLAARDAARRPEFYRALLEATVYVLGPQGEAAADGRVRLPPGAELSLQTWQRADGTPFIPFFTSKAALQRAIQGPAHFVSLPARALLETTRGSALVLNPGSDYGKAFSPAEVEALLAHGTAPTPERRVVGEPTEVLLGQPEEYPTALAASLGSLLARHAHVRAAYLALMRDPRESGPHLVIGIEAEGDAAGVIREAGAAASDVLRGQAIDFVAVEAGDTLSDYLLNQTKPFYVRT
ncbi:MAG TPA: enhanced serine sensitivity protein SseB C-terminal domain-containing protein [Myxococcales bacterium]|nr:enhanced serine sensitivity protein SseB C-terminal domain-containing protein [Myxococcales bacterium]